MHWFNFDRQKSTFSVVVCNKYRAIRVSYNGTDYDENVFP